MNYPTVAQVAQADLQQLADWHRHLPPPQTDVEHTVRRRINARVAERIRSEAPQVADALDDLMNTIQNLLRKGSKP